MRKIFRQTALDRLASPDELDQVLHITSPRTRLVLAAFAVAFAALAAWGVYGTIHVEARGRGMLIAAGPGGDGVSAVAFIPAREIAEVASGMEVYLSPETAPAGRSGYLLGHVTTVSPSPSTEEALAAALGDRGVVESVKALGTVFRVDVTLDRNPFAPDGRRWSLPQRKAPPLPAGTPCGARIRIAERRPAELLVRSPLGSL